MKRKENQKRGKGNRFKKWKREKKKENKHERKLQIIKYKYIWKKKKNK